MTMMLIFSGLLRLLMTSAYDPPTCNVTIQRGSWMGLGTPQGRLRKIPKRRRHFLPWSASPDSLLLALLSVPVTITAAARRRQNNLFPTPPATVPTYQFPRSTEPHLLPTPSTMTAPADVFVAETNYSAELCVAEDDVATLAVTNQPDTCSYHEYTQLTITGESQSLLGGQPESELHTSSADWRSFHD